MQRKKFKEGFYCGISSPKLLCNFENKINLIFLKQVIYERLM